jgi:hypothetical protein
MTTQIKPQWSYPKEWRERTKETLKIFMPIGATFYSTPSHGYLEIDTELLPAKVSVFDYVNGKYAYLEEDCSMTMWLAEMGLIPMEDYIKRMIAETPRRDAREILHTSSIIGRSK